MNNLTVKLSKDSAKGAAMTNTGGVGFSSEKKGLTLKNRLNSMNNTYSQTLTDRRVLIQ